MAVGTTTATSVAIPAAVDWLGLSKTLAIEAVFIASSLSAIFFHGGQDSLTLAFATGGTLGVLRLSDLAANAVNTRSYVNSPVAQKAGILPQGNTSALIATVKNGTSSDASTPAA